jgi:hypothetical protein
VVARRCRERVAAVEESSPSTDGSPRAGEIVVGTVEAVFGWGVIVDLKLTFPGLIDVLYVDDDDRYVVGQSVSAIVDGFDERKCKYVLRPPNQEPVIERLRRRGFLDEHGQPK